MWLLPPIVTRFDSDPLLGIVGAIVLIFASYLLTQAAGII